MIVGSRRKQRGALRTHDSAGEIRDSSGCEYTSKIALFGLASTLSTDHSGLFVHS